MSDAEYENEFVSDPQSGANPRLELEVRRVQKTFDSLPWRLMQIPWCCCGELVSLLLYGRKHYHVICLV